jgi:hypothetical protein
MKTITDRPAGAPPSLPLSMAARLRGAVLARPLLARWLLAGPGAVVATLLFAMAMPVWLPKGQAGVDNVVYPLILMPLIWAVTFVYACIEEDLPRCAAILCATAAVCGLTAALAFAGWL